MALEAFLKSNGQSPMNTTLPRNGDEMILEALASLSSLNNKEHLHSILSDVLNLTSPGNSSRSALGHNAAVPAANLTLPSAAYLLSHGNTTMEPYVNLSSYPMPFSSDNPVSVFYGDDTFSHLCQAREKESKKQHLGNTIGSTDLYKINVQTYQDSVPDRIKQGIQTLTPKRPRIDVNQVSIQQKQQHEIIQELLLKELQECNPQITEMIKQYRQQVPHLRGLHPQILKQLPKQQIRSLLQEQVMQQEAFTLLDGGICSRRFRQYLYHLRNNRHDNSITYWKKFVSEYYALDSKKRWCFSKYENIDLHTAGVFSPKSMETWCCQICGLKSGKGLEATFEIFPRLFKIMSESGMLDEILFLDSPRACKVSRGIVLEYRKVIQESVYETFRVVHKGTLRIVFGHDLKILSWEFCIENHEDFLLRTLFTPQVKQLVQAAESYQDIQNCVSCKATSQDLQNVCNMFVSAGTQIVRNMELPLVNDLGYPKRFIRCLQIAEVFDSMKDLMRFSHDTKMGPIECLNSYSQGSKTGDQMKGKRERERFVGAQNQTTFPLLGPRFHANGSWMSENGVISGAENSALALANLNHQLLGLNSFVAPARREGQESCITDHPDEVMAFGQSFNPYIHNVAPPSSSERGTILSQEAIQRLNQRCERSKELHNWESFNATVTQVSLANASITANFSKGASQGNLSTSSQKLTVKSETCSPEQFSEPSLSSAVGFSKIEDFSW